ncbi:MAG: DUF4956 domain-containing protein [Bacteroidales bacterium]|nr:DUF4956 domain-containing protein [Bacteroidales bacterium]
MINTIADASIELFKMQLIKVDDFLELLFRFSLNFAIIFFIVRFIYYPRTLRRDFFFTFILISVVVFMMCFLLESVKLQLGFALGLFAVFGIIRYRTTTIPIKEMTYLFIVIGISVVNALVNKKISYVELAFANIAICTITYFVERLRTSESESFATITYERIELVNTQKKDELIRDLENRLSIKIHRIEIASIDYVRDTAKINVYFLKSVQSWKNNRDIDFKILSNE